MDFILIAAAVIVAITLGLAVRSRMGDSGFATTVHEWEHGLLYDEGRFQRVLPPGRYLTLLTAKRVFTIPKWQQFLFAPSTDAISADRLVFRLSAMVAYRVEDPRAAQESQHVDMIRAAVSSALVNLAASQSLEDFLAGRQAAEGMLLSQVPSPIGGCLIERVSLTQITLPPELRRVFSEVQRARLEGLAALERARGEHAALRSLANAARMLKGNPELMNLRVLQALSAPGGRGQSMLVMGPTGLFPLPTDPAGEAPSG